MDGQVQWSNLCGGWRGKLVSSIACLAPVFSCRIVLMKIVPYIRRVLNAQNRKNYYGWDLSHSLNPSTRSIVYRTTQFDALRPLLAKKKAHSGPPSINVATPCTVGTRLPVHDG